MREYLIKRLLLMIPALVGVSFLTAALTTVVPGDAIELQLFNSPNFRKDDVAKVRHQLGLDKPFYQSFSEYLWNAAHGDLGKSLWTSKSVRDEIGRRVPVTFELALLSIVLSSLFAFTLGILSAARQDTLVDYLIRVTSILGLSVPNFVLGTLLLLVPVLWFGYLAPLSYIPFDKDPLGNLRQFIVPALALGIPQSAGVMRMVRSTMLEVLRQDYVRTAWAKGLRERVVIVRHVLRNTLIPVVTMVGQQFSYLLGGVVILEQIFSLPGVGRLALESIFTRDYPVLQGTTLLGAVVFLVMNLLVDLSYPLIDPRITYG